MTKQININASELVERDPQKMGGTPVFPGTGVPIKNLFDCLECDETLERSSSTSFQP
jgi:uncharacterized protein (DUF433 family)